MSQKRSAVDNVSTTTPYPSALEQLACGTGICSGSSSAAPLSDSHDRDTLCRTLILLLAKGRSVSLAELAQGVGWSQHEVVEVVTHQMNVELDSAGEIIGAGLTLQPTPHQVMVDDLTLYTWCALDALIYLPLLGRPIHVVSTCAVTGVPVRMTVTPQGVDNLEPPLTVVSIVKPAAGSEIRQAFCNHVSFFQSAEAAKPWQTANPNGCLLSVHEAFALGMHC